MFMTKAERVSDMPKNDFGSLFDLLWNKPVHKNYKFMENDCHACLFLRYQRTQFQILPEQNYHFYLLEFHIQQDSHQSPQKPKANFVLHWFQFATFHCSAKMS